MSSTQYANNVVSTLMRRRPNVMDVVKTLKQRCVSAYRVYLKLCMKVYHIQSSSCLHLNTMQSIIELRSTAYRYC